MSDINYISKGNKGGTVLGMYTSSLVGFYGIQPVNQPASLTAQTTTIAYVTATAFTPVTGIYVSAESTIGSVGFLTSAEADGVCRHVQNIQIRIGELEDVLQEVGLIAGGTSVVTATAQPFDYVGTGGGQSDGQALGQYTSSPISFWGVVPCDQPVAISISVTTSASLINTTMSIAATSSIGLMDTTISAMVSNSAGYGFTSGTVASHYAGHSFLGMINSLQLRLLEIETNLTEVGILPGATALTDADYDYLDKGNNDGTIMGANGNSKIAFWGGTPVKQATITTAMVTISYVSMDGTTSTFTTMKVGQSAFMFVSVTAGNTLLYAVQNAQTRLGEIEDALNSLGLQAT